MLSVSIVCRNNESTIARTLDSVAALGPEIVAVDSGSTDGTIGLLERAGARVIRSEWLGHVRTKQLALGHCTRPWVFCIDSDESLEPDLREAVAEAVRRDDPAIGGYLVNRKVYYRGRPLDHAWQPEHRLRLVRRAHARWTGLDPHDKLELIDQLPLPEGGGRGVGPRAEQAPTVEQSRGSGAGAAPSSRPVLIDPPPPSLRYDVTPSPLAVSLLPGTLRHDSIITFADFLAKQAVHARTMAASMHAEGRRGSLLALVTSPPGAFLKQLVLKRAFLDGWPGWLAAASAAAAGLMKHAALIELSRGGGMVAGKAEPPA